MEQSSSEFEFDENGNKNLTAKTTQIGQAKRKSVDYTGLVFDNKKEKDKKQAAKVIIRKQNPKKAKPAQDTPSSKNKTSIELDVITVDNISAGDDPNFSSDDEDFGGKAVLGCKKATVVEEAPTGSEAVPVQGNPAGGNVTGSHEVSVGNDANVDTEAPADVNVHAGGDNAELGSNEGTGGKAALEGGKSPCW